MRKREYQTSVKNPAVNFTNDDEVSNNNALQVLSTKMQSRRVVDVYYMSSENPEIESV
jgi:hypothetical protein